MKCLILTRIGGDLRVTVVADSNGNKNGWLADNFELVESFDDLIDVVVKAYKNRLLDIFLMNDEVITVFNHDATGTKEGINRSDTSKYYQFINFINSLYAETFVIEQDSDIQKLKGEPNISLANGNEFVAKKMKIGSNSRGMFAIGFIDIDGYEMTYSFFELKGATVTQQKGNK